MKFEQSWDDEDENINDEYAEVIEFIRADKRQKKAPAHLSRQILAYARAKRAEPVEKNWFLGQGPWVILTTIIAFSILILTLLVRSGM